MSRERCEAAGEKLPLRERGGPAEIIMGADRLHHDCSGQNENDLQQRFRREYLCKQRHVMLPAGVYGTDAR